MIFFLIKNDFYQRAIFQNLFSNLLHRRNCLKLKIIFNQEKSYTEIHRNFEHRTTNFIKLFSNRYSCHRGCSSRRCRCVDANLEREIDGQHCFVASAESLAWAACCWNFHASSLKHQLVRVSSKKTGHSLSTVPYVWWFKEKWLYDAFF